MNTTSVAESLRAPAWEFAAEVERRIESLTDQEYHRKPRPVKKLLEEFYPISRLGLHLKQPGLTVTVEAFGDDGVADGRIEEHGFREQAFDVQVTFLDGPEKALRRELLVARGVAPDAGPIKRDKKTKVIDATLEAVSPNHNLGKAAKGIAQLLQDKVSKKPYPPPTALLLAFDDITLRGFAMWSDLLADAASLCSFKGSTFASIYVLNCATNEIVQAA